jgi:hypothetical protein
MSSAAAVKNELARAGHPPDRVRGRAAALGDVARRESGLQKNLDLMAFSRVAYTCGRQVLRQLLDALVHVASFGVAVMGNAELKATTLSPTAQALALLPPQPPRSGFVQGSARCAARALAILVGLRDPCRTIRKLVGRIRSLSNDPEVCRTAGGGCRTDRRPNRGGFCPGRGHNSTPTARPRRPRGACGAARRARRCPVGPAPSAPDPVVRASLARCRCWISFDNRSPPGSRPPVWPDGLGAPFDKLASPRRRPVGRSDEPSAPFDKGSTLRALGAVPRLALRASADTRSRTLDTTGKTADAVVLGFDEGHGSSEGQRRPRGGRLRRDPRDQDLGGGRGQGVPSCRARHRPTRSHDPHACFSQLGRRGRLFVRSCSPASRILSRTSK